MQTIKYVTPYEDKNNTIILRSKFSEMLDYKFDYFLKGGAWYDPGESMWQIISTLTMSIICLFVYGLYYNFSRISPEMFFLSLTVVMVII